MLGENLIELGDATMHNAEHELKYVYVSAPAKDIGTCTDSTFGMTSGGISLQRDVEIYSRVREGVDSAFTYSTQWNDHIVSSYPEDKGYEHANDGCSFFIPEASFVNDDVRLGPYRLSGSFIRAYVESRTSSVLLPLEGLKIPDEYKDRSYVKDGYLYVSKKPYTAEQLAQAQPPAPQIGDLRLSWRSTPNTKPVLSCIGLQLKGELEPFDEGGYWVDKGSVSVQHMIDTKEEAEVETMEEGFLGMFFIFWLCLIPLMFYLSRPWRKPSSFWMRWVRSYGYVSSMFVSMIIFFTMYGVAILVSSPVTGVGFLALGVGLGWYLYRRCAPAPEAGGEE